MNYLNYFLFAFALSSSSLFAQTNQIAFERWSAFPSEVYASGETVKSGFPIELGFETGIFPLLSEVYYTLDGSEPTRSSPGLTNASLLVTTSATLKAIAYQTGSSIPAASGQLQIEIDPGRYPEIKLTHLRASEVDVTDAVVIHALASAIIRVESTFESGHIFYTLDGTAPTSTSLPYVTPVLITNTAVFQPIAYNSNFSLALPGRLEVHIELPFKLTVGGLPPTSRPLVSITPPSPSGDGRYFSNTVVTLSAEHGEGWEFKRWTGDLENTNRTVTLLMAGQKSVFAEYTTNSAGGSSTNGGRVVISPAQPRFNESASALAIPEDGYYFAGWTGGLSGSTNPAIFVVSNGIPVFEALFAPLPSGHVSLVVARPPETSEAVRITPHKNLYSTGEVVRLEIDLKVPPSFLTNFLPPYRFTGWAGDASGTANPLTVVMDRIKRIDVLFERAPEFERHILQPSSIEEQPAIAEDGTVYLVTGGALWSFTPELDSNWIVSNLTFTAHASIGGAGQIYVPHSNGDVSCFDARGRRIWKFTSGDTFDFPAAWPAWPGRVTVTSDETLYYVSQRLSAGGGANLYVVKNGILLHKSPSEPVCPVAGPDDTVYVHTATGFAAHRPFGNALWSSTNSLPVAIDANGRLFSTNENSIIAQDFEGKEVWRAEMASRPDEVLLGEDGRVFVQLGKSVRGTINTLVALNTNGSVAWEFPMQGSFVPLNDGGALVISRRPNEGFTTVGPGYHLWTTLQHVFADGSNGPFSTHYGGFPRTPALNFETYVLSEEGELYARNLGRVELGGGAFLSRWKGALPGARSSWPTKFGPRNSGRAVLPEVGPRLHAVPIGESWILRERGAADESSLEISQDLQNWEAVEGSSQNFPLGQDGVAKRFYRLRLD